MDAKKKDISRRDFLKIVGISTAATAGLAGCGPKGTGASAHDAQGDVPTGKMTLRTNPKTGENVSLLGYGCMRWPTLPAPEKGGNVIDQDAVNELIDYAMAHGVNYYDTSPVYVQGWSERSTGIALKRHPRDKFFVATKLSNFSNYTRENSIAMYHRSFEELQVDYIDYYLLHSVGNGGSDTFRARYIDKFSSTTSTGATAHRARTSMPTTSTANWRNAISPPSSWNRSWADGSRKCPNTSSRGSSSVRRRQAWPRGHSASRAPSPACSRCSAA